MDFDPLWSAYNNGPWPIFACMLAAWTALFGAIALAFERRAKFARYVALIALVLSTLLAGFVTVGTFIAFASQPKGPAVLQLATPFALGTVLFIGFAARLVRGERPVPALTTAAFFAAQIGLWMGAYITWSIRKAAESSFAEKCSLPSPRWGWAFEGQYLLAVTSSKRALLLMLVPAAIAAVVAIVDARRHRGASTDRFTRVIQGACVLAALGCAGMALVPTSPDPHAKQCEPVIDAQERIGRALLGAGWALQNNEAEKACQVLRDVQTDLVVVRDAAMRTRFDELFAKCK
ncbi:hypothetical protein LZC95_43740 [Pendulispora brunnea]|uniref:Integral membrane protein n=1 Tax=Pendulispora brunnea TaxID=2905690 RepID=A0ABZ2K732_9BACT